MEREAGETGPIRVLLLLSSLHGGGAERVAVHLLNHLDAKRFDIRMGLLRAAGPYLADADPARLMIANDGERRFDFEGANAAMYRPGKLLRGVIQAPRAYREMIERFRPHVVLSFLKGTNLIAWRALAGLGQRRPAWIAREGNNVLAVIGEETPNRLAARLVTWLTAHAYRRADRVLAISHRLGRDIARDLALDPAKVAVIHNPLDLAGIAALAAETLAWSPPRPFILTAGRLEMQKAHDLLLRAYAQSGAATTHDLVILGEGSLRPELEALVRQRELASCVHLPGFAANPFAWMAACDLFVLPSRWEGFGSALAEAQAAGAPVLATRCRYGPEEIVEHGVNGWLVPVEDETALAEAIARLLGDAPLRHRLSQAGRAHAARFGLETILARYAALLEETAASVRAA